MLQSTKFSALEAVARIAGLTALAGGVACQAKQNAAVSPVSPAAPSPEEPETKSTAPSKVSTADEEKTVDEEALFEESPPFPEKFDACRTELSKAAKAPIEQDVSDAAKRCCDAYVAHLEEEHLQSGEFRYFCCDIQNWMGSRACTPWGPPMPPVFKA